MKENVSGCFFSEHSVYSECNVLNSSVKVRASNVSVESFSEPMDQHYRG